jgi:hypothetical protein
MFRDKSVLPLFPSNVWAHDLEPSLFEPMNERLLARIEELIDPRPDTSFAELFEIAHEAVDGVLDFLQAERLPMEVTGAWANINPPGSPHSPHVHPNNYLSAVYFIRSPSGADTITFYDPRERAAMIAPRFKQLTKDNSLNINVEARTGRLAIFPAWLKHEFHVHRFHPQGKPSAVGRTLSRPAVARRGDADTCHSIALIRA